MTNVKIFKRCARKEPCEACTDYLVCLTRRNSVIDANQARKSERTVHVEVKKKQIEKNTAKRRPTQHQPQHVSHFKNRRKCLATSQYSNDSCLRIAQQEYNKKIARRKLATAIFAVIILLVFLAVCIVKAKDTSKEVVPYETSGLVTVATPLVHVEPAVTPLVHTTFTLEPIAPARISAYSAGETYYYSLTSYDKMLTAKVVYAESRGEIYSGKVAVAAVVFNRKESGKREFDTQSIESVIRQENAFAPINWIDDFDYEEVLRYIEGGCQGKAPVCKAMVECVRAVEDAAKGFDPTREVLSKGALFFYNPDRISETALEHRAGVTSITIGNHVFHYEYK